MGIIYEVRGALLKLCDTIDKRARTVSPQYGRQVWDLYVPVCYPGYDGIQ